MDKQVFYKACRDVIVGYGDPYATSYARRGLEMFDEDEIRTQALYILCNLKFWRGEEARRVKKILQGIAE